MELTESDLRAHMLWLRRLAVRLVRDPPEADDAVQDTLVAALEHPPALDRDVRPWLSRVLANFTHSGRRAERRRRNRETEAADLQGDEPPGADELLLRHEAARVVAGLVSQFREPHRGLVLLRFAEGLTPKEIARRQGVPEGTVRRQLKEALDRLRAGVAHHYGREARDWRMALVPLVRVARREDLLAGAWKGVIVMMAKSKIAVGIGTAGVVLAVVLALLRAHWALDPELSATAAVPRQGPGGGLAAPARPGVSAAATLAPVAPPPSFTGGAVPVDPPGCRQKLAELRALVGTRAAVFPATFESAAPSPKTEREVAPIVERVIGWLPGKPGYQLECRASVCRVGAVTEPGATPPTWLQALGQDQAFTALRGPNRSARAESVSTSDALTGAPLLQHWTYFNVPLPSDEEHPFEASAKATTCGERVVALQNALGQQRDQDQRRRGDETERQRRFQDLPANPDLTRKVAAALRGIMLDRTGAAPGSWECRGERDCRWRGPASVARSLEPPRINEALAIQGLSADEATAQLRRAKDDGSKEGEAELALHLGDRDRGGAGGAPGRRSEVVHVESTSADRTPQ
jgi:RNA polymerase sigma factor (sigma-70 family)